MRLTRVILVAFLGIFLSPCVHAKTWYIRPDGGTRYSANMPNGQCDGSSDAAYSGHGRNQHCAYKDFRYMWDDESGKVGSGSWVISGGDTVIIRGCAASQNQSNSHNPDCRIGWDAPTGTGANLWCYGVGSYTCFNPPIPPGTPAQHTRILGQNYANCNAGGATNPRDYSSSLSQIFGGFSLKYVLNLADTQYVDIQCLEVTSHNGKCTKGGAPAFPRACHTDQPLDDYDDEGIRTDRNTSHILLQDVYIHGHNDAGLFGPIGGPIKMVRVFSGFNGKVGWQFDDGNNTPDAPGSSIDAHYVTMIGNGCYEEYPVKHAFSAQACYDDVSNGFGDAWSGQDTDLDSFNCDHCVTAYNTKDAFIGPHVNIKRLTVVNSASYGNMGAQWKWNNAPDSKTTFINNLTIGNCLRFQEAIPGAVHSFAQSSGLPGAYLTDFCRAGGNTVAINSQRNSYVLFANNTFVDYLDTVFLLSCGPAKQNRNGECASTPFVFRNNIFLGYHLAGNDPPGLFYLDDRSISVTDDHNLEFGNRRGAGSSCSGTNICADPRLVNEPEQRNWANQTFLDNFNFVPQHESPAIGHGQPMNGIVLDHFGKLRPTPPTIGAVEPQ